MNQTLVKQKLMINDFFPSGTKAKHVKLVFSMKYTNTMLLFLLCMEFKLVFGVSNQILFGLLV